MLDIFKPKPRLDIAPELTTEQCLKLALMEATVLNEMQEHSIELQRSLIENLRAQRDAYAAENARLHRILAMGLGAKP